MEDTEPLTFYPMGSDSEDEANLGSALAKLESFHFTTAYRKQSDTIQYLLLNIIDGEKRIKRPIFYKEHLHLKKRPFRPRKKEVV